MSDAQPGSFLGRYCATRAFLFHAPDDPHRHAITRNPLGANLPPLETVEDWVFERGFALGVRARCCRSKSPRNRFFAGFGGWLLRVVRFVEPERDFPVGVHRTRRRGRSIRTTAGGSPRIDALGRRVPAALLLCGTGETAATKQRINCGAIDSPGSVSC